MTRVNFPSVSPKIVLGVTVADSWILLSGFPEKLVSAGWDVHLVSHPGPRLDAYEGLPGITIHGIPMAREISPGQDLRSLRAWMRLLRTLKPAVVSVGTPKAGLLGIISSALSGKATRIYHLRGLRLETARGLQRSILWSVEWLTMALANQVLSVSPSLSREVISEKLVSARKISVLGPGSSNGVDLARFKPGQDFSAAITPQGAAHDAVSGLRPGVPVLGFVGRLSSDKGVAVLFEALSVVARTGVDYQLLVVGAHEGADLSSAQQEELGSRLVFTGAVADVAPLYAQMDALVLPTMREGFPNVCLEAQASGIPVITTTATGAIDSIEDEVTGLLVPPGDAPALAAALTRVLSGEKTFNQEDILGFVQQFDRDRIQQLHLDYYAACVQR